MVGRLIAMILVFIIVTVILIFVYGWALIQTLGWKPSALIDEWEETGFLQQYEPVVQCFKIRSPRIDVMDFLYDLLFCPIHGIFSPNNSGMWSWLTTADVYGIVGWMKALRHWRPKRD